MSEPPQARKKVRRMGVDKIYKEDGVIASIMISYRRMITQIKMKTTGGSNVNIPIGNSNRNRSSGVVHVSNDNDSDTVTTDLKRIISTLEGDLKGASYTQLIAEMSKLESTILFLYPDQAEGLSLLAMKEALTQYNNGNKF